MNNRITNLLLQKETLNVLLESYANAFENLSPNNYRESLSHLLAEDVYFKDPFNELHGKEETLKVFAHMFDSVDKPKFKVTHFGLLRPRTQYRHDKDPFIGMLYWQFNFRLKNSDQELTIDGTSRVTFNNKGLINRHIDYWDPSETIYKRIPVVSWLIKKIRQKLSIQ